MYSFLITAFICIALSVSAIRYKSKVSLSFAFLCFCCAMWSVELYLLSSLENLKTLLPLFHTFRVGLFFIAPAMLLLSVFITHTNKTWTNRITTLSFAISFGISILNNTVLPSNLVYSPNGYLPEPDLIGLIYKINFVMSVICSLAICAIAHRKTIFTQRQRITWVIMAYLVGSFFGVLSFSYSKIFGTLGAVSFLSLLAYSEFRYRLISIRVHQEKLKHVMSLAGSIAHEMRNPLSQIHGAIHLLKNNNSTNNDEFHEYYEDVIDVIKNSHQIIDITMDAINDKPIKKDDFKIISALDICHQAVSEYAYKDSMYRKKVAVIGGDFQILADPVLVKYILYNLIGNALYYIQSNPKANIVITLKEEQRKIEVRDMGPGIAPENLSKLFDSFYTSGKSGGTGLGLAYCKRTMQALDGDIHCISELGKFTSFILTFPPKPPQLRVVKEPICTDY